MALSSKLGSGDGSIYYTMIDNFCMMEKNSPYNFFLVNRNNKHLQWFLEFLRVFPHDLMGWEYRRGFLRPPQSRVGPGTEGSSRSAEGETPARDRGKGSPGVTAPGYGGGRLREKGALSCPVLTWELGTAIAKGAWLPLPRDQRLAAGCPCQGRSPGAALGSVLGNPAVVPALNLGPCDFSLLSLLSSPG